MIERVSAFLNRQTHNITIAALILAAASFSADILGLVRDRILASEFGAGQTLDVYYASFRVPDLLLNILILGAVSSAFLPVFAERFAKDEEDALNLSSNVLTLAGLALLALSGVLFFIIPWLMPFIAPGFSGDEMSRTVMTTRVLLLSPILFGISSVVSSVLQYFRRFFLYSLAPILYNLGIIIGALFLAPRYHELGLAFGVVLGAFMHLSVQVWGLHSSGVHLRLVLLPVHKAVKSFISLAAPRSANLIVNQLQVTGLTAIASIFAAGSIAVFNFGTNLASVPIGVIGVSFATAAFPALSRYFAVQDNKGFSRALSQSIREVLFFALPASAIFLVLRAHIVRVVLGAGAFNWENTRLTAAVLGALALGVVAQALFPLLIRAFFARKNTKLPLNVAVWGAVLIVSGALSLANVLSAHETIRRFVGVLFRVSDLPDIRIVVLALIVSAVTFLQVIVLLWFLREYFYENELRKLGSAFARLLLISLIAGFVTWLTAQVLARGVSQHTGIGILLQGAAAGFLGSVAYLLLALFFAFPEARKFMRILRQYFPPIAALLPLVEDERESEPERYL